ncbi:MAG TPA: hypothetical protein VHB21_03545, partial [Minicystis sp.]|nr:hypothetical protein [Minicystis sp.]
SAPRAETPPAASVFVDLVWFDAALPARVRSAPAFKALFSAQQPSWRKAGEEPKAKDPTEVRDRRDVMRVLTGGAALDPERARDALEASFQDPVEFSYPVVLVGGELAVTFDEQALLKASLQVGATLAGTDKRLRDALAVATEGTRAEPAPTPEGYAALLRHLQEAFGAGRGAPTALETAATRLTLEERSYKRKVLLGAKRLRAEISATNGGAALPVYLPESLASALPLVPRMRARVVGELRQQEDHTETHPLALVALAVGRIIKG